MKSVRLGCDSFVYVNSELLSDMVSRELSARAKVFNWGQPTRSRHPAFMTVEACPLARPHIAKARQKSLCL